MSKKMSKEDWKQRHQDLIDHRDDLKCVIGRLEEYNKRGTAEYEELVKQLELTEMAVKIAEAEAAK